MDPVSRRKVWNLIERVKRDRITILTVKKAPFPKLFLQV